MSVTLPFGPYGFGWKYLLLLSAIPSPAGWDTLAFDDSAWSTGQGGFGNGFLGFGSPVMPQVANTVWAPDLQPSATTNDLLLRLVLPASCGDPQITLAVDDEADLRVNGLPWYTQSYTGGYYVPVGSIPAWLRAASGGADHLLAVRARDFGLGAAYFDMAVKCKTRWHVGQIGWS